MKDGLCIWETWRWRAGRGSKFVSDETSNCPFFLCVFLLIQTAFVEWPKLLYLHLLLPIDKGICQLQAVNAPTNFTNGHQAYKQRISLVGMIIS